MRIVFMGTPEFAQASLQKLIETGHNIVGVFTQPDKPKGRGYKLVAPPVKELALEHNIPVYQPEKMKDGTALSILKELNPDLIAVVAYGRILPKDILELPKYGCINVHGSLLPKYQGPNSLLRQSLLRQPTDSRLLLNTVPYCTSNYIALFSSI